MKGFFKSRGFKVVIAVVLMMLGLLLYSASMGGTLLSSLVGFVTTPMQQMASDAKDAAGDVAPTTKSADELQKENDALKAEKEELERQLNALTIDYLNIKKNNAQFEKYLELKNDNPSFQFVPADVIGRDPNAIFYEFTLDQGSSAGVSKYDPVITNLGVVGWVSEVGVTWCRVTTLLSPDSGIGCVDKQSGDSGTVTGDYNLVKDNLAKMKYIAAQNDVKAGDIVVTAGLGGIYPKNLPVGKVKEVKHEDYDVSIYAVIEPFEDVRTVESVFIITEFTGQGDVINPSSTPENKNNSSSQASSENSSSESPAPSKKEE